TLILNLFQLQSFMQHQFPQYNPVLWSVMFHSQPPPTLRKSNFFNFTLSLHDKTGAPIQILQSMFAGFLNDPVNADRPYNNGTTYNITIRDPQTGYPTVQVLMLRMVDSHAYLPIPYEGADRNPDLRKVLFTHESICNRCSSKSKCGNQKDASDDPEIREEGKVLKFFLKCNQNCTRTAGNPREHGRRFVVSCCDVMDFLED